VQLTGKIRQEGDPMSAMSLGAILARFKQMREAPGLTGMGTRALLR